MREAISLPEGFAHDVLTDRLNLRYGFLLSGYQEDYYYWEVLSILRKSFIVLLITFLDPISSGC